MTFIIKVIAMMAIIALPPVKAQIVEINCRFEYSMGLYSCEVASAFSPDNENATFVIGGVHASESLGNDDVEKIEIRFSTIPFIITQFFTVFPNVIDFSIWLGGLTRIQSNAFANARNLKTLYITGHQGLHIQPYAFTGARSLQDLQFSFNQFETLHETAFEGITELRIFYAQSNQIQKLHADLFKTLTSLEWLYLAHNKLESLDGRLLANSPNVTRIEITTNQINAIGRNFLDGLTQLETFLAFDNPCVDNSWTIDGTTTIETVRQGLETCFENFD